MPVLVLLFTCSLVSCFILTVIRLYGSVIFPRIRSVVEISAWILVCINCRTPTTVREIQDTYNSERDTGHLQQRERYRTPTTAREIQDTYNSEGDTGHLQQRERYRTPTTAREIQDTYNSEGDTGHLQQRERYRVVTHHSTVALPYECLTLDRSAEVGPLPGCVTR